MERITDGTDLTAPGCVRPLTPAFQWVTRFGCVFIIQLALSACAMGQTMVNHSFSFDTRYDSPDVEVLDYQYGNSKQFGTRADPERVQLGQVFGQHGISGAMTRGDFLYVKWRIKQTGQEYEDKVDLTTRLPANIADYGIHFVIKGSQLYVYMIPPPGVWPAGAVKRSASEVGVSDYLKQHQIYPDQKSKKGQVRDESIFWRDHARARSVRDDLLLTTAPML